MAMEATASLAIHGDEQTLPIDTVNPSVEPLAIQYDGHRPAGLGIAPAANRKPQFAARSGNNQRMPEVPTICVHGIPDLFH